MIVLRSEFGMHSTADRQNKMAEQLELDSGLRQRHHITHMDDDTSIWGMKPGYPNRNGYSGHSLEDPR